MTKYKRRGRKPPPFRFNPEDIPSSLPGYIATRLPEYQAYDALPAPLRKALRRCKHEWQATQILKRVKDGDSMLDIIRDLERCEKAYSEIYLSQFDLNNLNGDLIWKLKQQEK